MVASTANIVGKGAAALLLPYVSNQKMSAYLKEIADLCGITKRLTTHVARHTFATTVTCPFSFHLNWCIVP